MVKIITTGKPELSIIGPWKCSCGCVFELTDQQDIEEFDCFQALSTGGCAILYGPCPWCEVTTTFPRVAPTPNP